MQNIILEFLKLLNLIVPYERMYQSPNIVARFD